MTEGARLQQADLSRPAAGQGGGHGRTAQDKDKGTHAGNELVQCTPPVDITDDSHSPRAASATSPLCAHTGCEEEEEASSPVLLDLSSPSCSGLGFVVSSNADAAEQRRQRRRSSTAEHAARAAAAVAAAARPNKVLAMDQADGSTGAREDDDGDADDGSKRQRT